MKRVPRKHLRGAPSYQPSPPICGVVIFFESGERVANAKVTLLQDSKEIAMQLTKEDGKFSFDQLKAGNYELHVRFESIPFPIVAVTKVVLVHPEPKSKREIAVNMRFGGGRTGQVRGTTIRKAVSNHPYGYVHWQPRLHGNLLLSFWVQQAILHPVLWCFRLYRLSFVSCALRSAFFEKARSGRESGTHTTSSCSFA